MTPQDEENERFIEKNYLEFLSAKTIKEQGEHINRMCEHVRRRSPERVAEMERELGLSVR